MHRAATGLSKDHALALAARRALGGTLALLDDKQGAREQFRVVLRFLEAREPACPPALVEEMRRLLDGVGGGGGGELLRIVCLSLSVLCRYQVATRASATLHPGRGPGT